MSVSGPEEVRAILDRHAGELMAVPGVIGVAVGDEEGALVLDVLVDRADPRHRKEIPAEIEGVGVRIREAGEIEAPPPAADPGS